MRIFVSDLHLDQPQSLAFRTFAAMLGAESARAQAIYILGDLCEVWVGDDDDGPLATDLRTALRTASARCPVYVLHGNRDFLLGERFTAETGCVLLTDPTLLDDRTLVAHGDAFCIDDEAYQEARITLRSEQWQTAVLSRPLTDRRALARGMREDSQRTNANKASNIMDVAVREVERVVRGCDARYLVHGHTHRPGVHRANWGTRFVLGAWERCGWLLRMQPGKAPQLECFPLAGHYGT